MILTDKKYRFYNNLIAWSAFFIALITYTLTVEPTVSLWDCGEFIASSYKLEVGHPPGAPLYMLMGRVFSIFAPSTKDVALMINYVSVLSSAFTILFLFWTITYFAKKVIIKTGEISQTNAIAIFASGLIGALAYTFSDSFWFSAVEAEVYANSSLFTAVVFWAILKWEAISDEKYSNRWLIFIAYLMGLSIGVHLLNLLALPAIVFVYYFKKYKTTNKGIFYASLLSVVLVAFLMYGIIQGYVLLASKFELLFVNSFGLAYNSGLFAFIILTVLVLAYGIYYSIKKKKVVLNTILTAVTVILIGYSSFAIIMIRSYANPPMDENNPENVFALLSYLNREQYGSRPLIYGQYYDAEFEKTNTGEVKTEPRYTYIPDAGKYLQIEKTNPEYFYDPERKTFFPRIYSRKRHHISAYQTWGNVDPGEKPSFGNNLAFFFKYQLGHMYFRYFMWNFSGRQNNLQSHGVLTKGNAITGLPFIDNVLIGSQKKAPDKLKNDKSRNVYYMLPLILGMIGLFYLFKADVKNASILLLLFFFTGIAIVIYLNQTPYQPRERDYAYSGSFYTFSIWIGLGVTGIYHFLRKKMKLKIAVLLTLFFTIPVPLIMAVQNWDDHDRSGRYTARDMAKNYLESCDENAILFTYGDNDTFPLWYVQEVEGFRTDIKVVNLSLLGTDWYINQMRKKTYDADPIPFKMEHKQYYEGVRDACYVLENPDIYLDEKYAFYEINLRGYFYDLKNNLKKTLENSSYSQQNFSEYIKLKEELDKITPVQFAGLIGNLSDERFIDEYQINKSDVDLLMSETKEFLTKISEKHLPLEYAMDFVASDSKNSKLGSGKNEIDYLPANKLSLSVPWAKVANSSSFTAKELSLFEKSIEWEIANTYIYKGDMAVLEIIARNGWERPIYFATSVPDENYYGLDKYFRLEGFAYRLVPYKSDSQFVSINTDVMYENLMNKFSWGRMNADDVYIDNFNLRNFKIMEIRKTFYLLSAALILENKIEKAEKVLNKCVEIMPNHKVPYDKNILGIAEGYFIINNIEKAEKIIDILLEIYRQDLAFYESIQDRHLESIYSNKMETLSDLNNLLLFTEKYNREELIEKIKYISNFYR